MPQDDAHQDAEALAVWIWDLGLRRIRAANAPALALWGASNEMELFARPFGPADPMTSAGLSASTQLEEGASQARLEADISDRRSLLLHADRPTAAAHILRFAHQIGDTGLNDKPALPVDAFNAAPFAMTLLSSNGVILRDNAAAAALFGAERADRWQARHRGEAAGAASLAQALRRGGASYSTQLNVLGGARRLSVTLSAFASDQNAEQHVLATIAAIPDDETVLSANPAEQAMQAAPSAVAVFSLENEELLFANDDARGLASAFEKPGDDRSTLAEIFPINSQVLREARRQLLLDTQRRPVSLTLNLNGAALAVEATLGLWRGSSALYLWMRRSAAGKSDETPQPVAPEPRPTVAGGLNVSPFKRIALAQRVAEASHSLRTNITSIRGFAELVLSEPPMTALTEERLRDIMTASDEFSETLEAFLHDLMQLIE